MSKNSSKQPVGKYCKKRPVRAKKIKKVNWYWDIRLWSPVYILILLLVILSNKTPSSDISEERVSSLEPTVGVVEATEETIPEPTLSVDEEEIIALARLADSVAGGRSEDVKRAIMWVAINRTEDRSNGYGLSLRDEINRPKQWQQYNPSGAYLESTVAVAQEVHDIWRQNKARMIPQDMLWFVLNGDGSITVRNQFKEGKNRAEMTFGQ